MEEILCGEEKTAGLPKELLYTKKYPVPQCYLEAKYIVPISIELRQMDGKRFCTLPLCQTVEVEALGGTIHYATDEAGPRVGQRTYASLTELPVEKELPINCGLYEEVYKAAKELKNKGEEVVLNLSGPVTVLSGLVDMQVLFVERKKKKEVYERALRWITGFLKSYMLMMKDQVKFFSFADPAGSIDILGEKCCSEVAELSYIPLLQWALEQEISVHLCPRVTAVLLQGGYARKEERAVVKCDNYEEAIQALIEGEASIVAHQCLKKKKDQKLMEKIQILELS